MNKIFLKDELQTKNIGARLAVHCAPPLIIFFSGNLGAGKTTLVRSLLRALGISGAIKSPTFSLIEPYELAEQTLLHIDLYRLASPEELEYLGLRDYLNDTTSLLVEWPEKGAGVLPSADLHCHLEILPQGRQLTLTAGSEKGTTIIQQLGLQRDS